MTALLPFERSFRDWIDREGMGWERLSVPTADGEDTAAYRFRPRVHPRARIVAAHGAGNDALFAWIGLFKRLLLRGMEVFTFDLPGHGRGGRSRFTAESAVATTRSVLERCERMAPEAPLHAVGVSLGASILLATLRSCDDLVSSAVLVSPPLRIVLSAASFVRELSPANLAVLLNERADYGLTGLIPSFGPFKRDVYPLRLASQVPPGPFGYVHALNDALDSLRLEEAARHVDLPVLLVHGEHDRIVPIEQSERLARLLPDVTFERVPGATHLSAPLRRPVVDRVVSWLADR